jgi:hypothetical protein
MLVAAVQSASLVELQKALGIRMAHHPLRDDTRAIADDSLSFPVDPLGDGPLARGVGSVAVYEAFAVTGPEGETSTVLATGPDAFTDRNRNGIADDDTPRTRHPVAVLVKVGAGEVLLIGDDSVLANQSLATVPGNREFAFAVARWLAGVAAPAP